MSGQSEVSGNRADLEPVGHDRAIAATPPSARDSPPGLRVTMIQRRAGWRGSRGTSCRCPPIRTGATPAGSSCGKCVGRTWCRLCPGLQACHGAGWPSQPADGRHPAHALARLPHGRTQPAHPARIQRAAARPHPPRRRQRPAALPRQAPPRARWPAVTSPPDPAPQRQLSASTASAATPRSHAARSACEHAPQALKQPGNPAPALANRRHKINSARPQECQTRM
jgi:hypothetical protein